MFTAFDIETGPLPREVLDSLIDPFPPFEPPGPFDPAMVKYGNTKDEAKKAEKLEAARLSTPKKRPRPRTHTPRRKRNTRPA